MKSKIYPTLADVERELRKLRDSIRSAGGMDAVLWIELRDDEWCWGVVAGVGAGVGAGDLETLRFPLNHRLYITLKSNLRALARMAVEDLKEQVMDRL